MPHIVKLPNRHQTKPPPFQSETAPPIAVTNWRWHAILENRKKRKNERKKGTKNRWVWIIRFEWMHENKFYSVFCQYHLNRLNYVCVESEFAFKSSSVWNWKRRANAQTVFVNVSHIRWTVHEPQTHDRLTCENLLILMIFPLHSDVLYILRIIAVLNGIVVKFAISH